MPGVTNILGLEFSGVVQVVGDSVETEERHHWKVGDEVFGLLYGGGYAEYVAVSKKILIKKPAELTWEQCGGICEVSTSFSRLFINRGTAGNYDVLLSCDLLKLNR
jgi:NADPH:quinone reductase-like Zn-dependent oxidoreductase